MLGNGRWSRSDFICLDADISFYICETRDVRHGELFSIGHISSSKLSPLSWSKFWRFQVLASIHIRFRFCSTILRVNQPVE